MEDELGVSDGYFDVDGVWQPTPETARGRIRASMGELQPASPMWFVTEGSTDAFWSQCRIELEDGGEVGPSDALPADLPLGYHSLVPVDGGPPTWLVVHPPACPSLPRLWGVAAQLYALWSDESWGIGDLGDLRTVARRLRAAGGTAILMSPLHQPAPSIPQQDSPYYPSSRRGRNPLLIAPSDRRPAHLACVGSELIERDHVWAAKRAVLVHEFAASGEHPTPSTIAVWNALCDRHGPDWSMWPTGLHRFDAAMIDGLTRSDRSLATLASFHEWCQQRVASQLADVASSGVQLIGDLAIGFSPAGADAWEYQDLLALDMRVGVPPDTFNAAGQEWGIPPFVPWKVRKAQYAPFIATIRANLRGVHGLRIDHVMGLFRQYWIPAGGAPADGAYVTFPADELLAIVCLEATRAGAFVVGEDLGTVAEGVREALTARRIAGTKVLWFEDDPPSEWPEHVLATVTTHDLPTIAGVAAASDGDVELRERLAAATGGQRLDDIATVVAATHAAILAAPSDLRLVSLDDLCLSPERPNHPGTTDQPNWRRRLPLSVDTIPFEQLAAAAP